MLNTNFRNATRKQIHRLIDELESGVFLLLLFSFGRNLL